jgi:hypothetical protein
MSGTALAAGGACLHERYGASRRWHRETALPINSFSKTLDSLAVFVLADFISARSEI